MQMMKNNKGITLVSLIVTVIVMSILATVGVRVVYVGMSDAKTDKLNTELGIVRQAILEQYALAEAVRKIEVLPNQPQVSFWLGQRIDNFSDISLPDQSQVESNEEVIRFYRKNGTYHCTYQEDYYYRLTPQDLEKIGITKTEDTYVVNYKTGEVYNETKQMTSDAQLLYLPSTLKENAMTQTGDPTSFNDWNGNE